MKRGFVVVGALTWLLVVACGGSETKPSLTPDPAGSGSAVADTPTPPGSSTTGSPPAASSVAAADPPPASAADAGSSAPKPSPPGGVTIENKDECTPVGIDFEKRARPKLKDCYAEGKKKEPNLEGTVKIKITVDVKGKIKATKVIEKTLPDKVAECMLKVVKATPFPEVEKCWDASLTIPITFPTPR